MPGPCRQDWQRSAFLSAPFLLQNAFCDELVSSDSGGKLCPNQHAGGGGRRGEGPDFEFVAGGGDTLSVMREVKEKRVDKLSGIGRRGRGRAGAKLRRDIVY